jgi:hypothetical protein
MPDLGADAVPPPGADAMGDFDPDADDLDPDVVADLDAEPAAALGRERR